MSLSYVSCILSQLDNIGSISKPSEEVVLAEQNIADDATADLGGDLPSLSRHTLTRTHTRMLWMIKEYWQRKCRAATWTAQSPEASILAFRGWMKDWMLAEVVRCRNKCSGTNRQSNIFMLDEPDGGENENTTKAFQCTILWQSPRKHFGCRTWF